MSRRCEWAPVRAITSERSSTNGSAPSPSVMSPTALAKARAGAHRRQTDPGRAAFTSTTALVDGRPTLMLTHDGDVRPTTDREGGVRRRAVRLANDSEYGLSASVFSADVDRAQDIADAAGLGGAVQHQRQ